MTDIAAAFHGEEKSGRCLGPPGNESFPGWLSIERVVQLDRVEMLGVEGEVFSGRHLFGIEPLSPVSI
jgi:hypothetical protein